MTESPTGRPGGIGGGPVLAGAELAEDAVCDVLRRARPADAGGMLAHQGQSLWGREQCADGQRYGLGLPKLEAGARPRYEVRVPLLLPGDRIEDDHRRAARQ